MFKSKHLNQEIRQIEEKIKNNKVSQEDVVKSNLLVAKLVRDVRTNMTLIMKHLGIELIKPDVRDEGTADTGKTEE